MYSEDSRLPMLISTEKHDRRNTERLQFRKFFRGRTMEAFTNEFDLARNFGFDITMPDGNMGLPGAVHRDYMDKCQGLYREFLNKMNTHIKYEKEVKKVLTGLHKEKIRNLRFSLYRTENECHDNDPFARRPNSTVSQTGLTSRTNTPWGLDVIKDEDETPQLRPQTAPSLGQKSVDENAVNARPKTAGGVLKRDAEDEAGTDVTAATTKTILGIVDAKTEGTVSQKIIVGQHSFTNLEHGQLRAKLKNRDGKFIIKPVKADYHPDDDMAVFAYDPSKTKKSYDPLNEKMALVRKITNFRSPTISSDMKINNRVPIQKTLKGLNAKRTTVVEIYRNARDRKARHFRIVSAKTRYGTPGAPGDEDKDVLNSNDSPTSKRPKTLSDFRTKAGVFARMANLSRLSNNHLRVPNSPSPTHDDCHLSVSQTGNKLKSILHIPTMNDYPDSGRESQTDYYRPGSKVAFARNDSNISDQNKTGLLTPDVARNRSESFNSNSGRNMSMSTVGGHPNRQRCVTETSEIDDCVFPSSPHHRNSDVSMASVVVAAMRQRASMQSGTVNEENGAPVPDMVKSPAAGGRRLSIASVVSASSFINKLKKATQNTKDAEKSDLGFDLPAKMESRVDTVKIVKQQMKQDQNLDERMTVWRRRMALKSSNSSLSVKKRNTKMRLL